MGLFRKVIKVHGKKTRYCYSSLIGEFYIYPKGTIRDVKLLTLFGYANAQEMCTEETQCNTDDCIDYNKWRLIS